MGFAGGLIWRLQYTFLQYMSPYTLGRSQRSVSRRSRGYVVRSSFGRNSFVCIVFFCFLKIVKGMKKNVSTDSATKTSKIGLYVVTAILVLLGISYYFSFGFSGGGPGSYKVLEKSRVYLETKYGKKSNDSEISCGPAVVTSEKPDKGYFIVEYQFDDKEGKLKVSYDNYQENKKLEIVEFPPQKP